MARSDPTDRPAPTAEEKALADALKEAMSSGKPVLVSHLTTEGSQTFATPRGTLTTDAAATPERVRAADGGWKPVDATLRTRPDGTIAPAAVPSGLSFSGGGNDAMATMTTSNGGKLVIRAPFPLPRPTLDGDSAVYAGVLPDIDLRLSANRLGGWRQVLIIHTAEAAANPALKKLHFGVDSDGLKVTSDSAGNLSVTDDQGKIRFSSPPSLMWDSASEASTSAALAKGAATRTQQAAPAETDPVRSTPDGPGPGAAVAGIVTAATAQGIDLVPDAGLLSRGTGPWYIDPGVNPTADSGTLAWSQVQEAHPDTNGYNGTEYGQDKPATGYCGYVASNPPCSEGRTRAYFKIGINSRIHNATVLDARFYATIVQSSSPSTSTPMGLYATEDISNPTSWNHQPCARASRMGGCPKLGPSANVSGTGDISFNVTSKIREAAANNWSQQTFGLAPDDETNKYYRQRFSNDAHVVTEYDIRPTIGSPRTRPAPGFARDGSYADCPTNRSEAGWIGANTNVTLNASTSSATGRQLKTSFAFWDNDNGATVEWAETPWNGSSGDVSVDIGSQLTDGHQYGWNARTTDDTLTSATTQSCYFHVDRTPPTAAVTSTDFPESGTIDVHPKHVGEEGSFTLTGTDPAPDGGGRNSGLACARWTTDPTRVAATGWKCTDGDSRIVKLTDGKATVKVTPPRWGTNYVYLQTQDNAGNMSQPSVYSYYAPSNPDGSKPTFGDVTGDRTADILLPDTAGDLRQIGGGTDPHAAPNARIGSSPSGTGWRTIQTTHRGSLGYRNVDDLFAHQPGDPKLFLYRNDANGGRFDGLPTISMAKPTDCVAPDSSRLDCTAFGYGQDWSKVSDIAAFGSLTGDSATDGTLPRTSLVFTENGRLWLSAADDPDRLGTRAILLSANDARWDGYNLITPGRAQGTDFPTLWARSKTDGTLHAFTVKGTRQAPDVTGLTDPAQGVIAGVVIDPKAYPRVGSDGDLTGDGIPDLWAVDTNQQLVSWNGTGTRPSTSVPYPTVTSFQASPTLQGNLNMPKAAWKLTGQTSDGTVEETGKQINATAAAITWPTATINGSNSDYAAFNGEQSTIATKAAVVDTAKSFTLSTWVTASQSTGVILSQDNTQSSDFMLWPERNGSYWRFAIANTTSTSTWKYDATDAGDAQTRVNPNIWTRLTAVYNADTGRMSLYVNGELAGSGYHDRTSSQSAATSGPLVLGRSQSAGKPEPGQGGLHGGVSNLAVYPYAASVTAPGSSGPITVTSAAGTCIDNNNGSTGDGNPIQLWSCAPVPAQQFELRDDGTLRIQGKCVETAGSGTANGTLIQLMTCKGTPNQQWQALANGNLYHPASKRCLDRNNNTLANGTQLHLWGCATVDAQRWTTATLGTAALPAPVPLADNGNQPTLPPLPAGYLRNLNSKSCLETADSRADNGAPAQQWACGSQSGGRWEFRPTANALAYEIRNENSGKCLEIGNSSLDDGAPAQQWTCSNLPTQLWTIQRIGTTANWNITNLNSGKTLEINNSSLANGAPAQQWGHAADPAFPSQTWYR